MRHPLHPALVHFPIAAWALALPADIAAWWLNQPYWWSLSSLLITTGVVMALPAMLAGMLDFTRLENDDKILKTAFTHIALIGTAWSFYLVSLVLRLTGEQTGLSLAAFLSACGGLVALLAGAWCGGELVYRYGAGVTQTSPARSDRAP